MSRHDLYRPHGVCVENATWHAVTSQSWTPKKRPWTSPSAPCKSSGSTKKASGKPSSRAICNSSSSSSNSNSSSSSKRPHRCRKKLTASAELLLHGVGLAPLAAVAAAGAVTAAVMATAGQATAEGHLGRITLTQGNCLPACLLLLLLVSLLFAVRTVLCMWCGILRV